MFIARSIGPSQRDDCNNHRTIRPFRKTWHNGSKPTKLYDRASDQNTLDEVERIVI
jgi:hypothetical protein